MNTASDLPIANWLPLLLVPLLLYRALLCCFLEAFHALTSLQRRLLVEEDDHLNPQLADLLERPHALGLGIALFNHILLVLLMLMAWPLHPHLYGGAYTLAGLFLIYLWALDYTLPTLLVGSTPAEWLKRLFPIYHPAHTLLTPLVTPLAHFVEQKRGAHEKRVQEETEDDDDEGEGVTALLEEGEAEGILEKEDRELIQSLVGFNDSLVRELMTPRTAMQAIDVGASVDEVWAAFRASRHSRLPLVDGHPDQIIGILRLKELIQIDDNEPLDLKGLATPAFFVPESKPSLDLLRDMQNSGSQMAIVVDEFGSVSGIVTLQNLLEAVFGEIREEHETPAEIQETSQEGVFRVSGHLHMEDLEEQLGLEWPREGFDTIAGFIMSRLGRIPKVQESLEVEGARLTVLEMNGARILTIRVEKI